jgi:hypothetical protein
MALDIASLLIGVGMGVFAVICVRAVDLILAKRGL